MLTLIEGGVAATLTNGSVEYSEMLKMSNPVIKGAVGGNG